MTSRFSRISGPAGWAITAALALVPAAFGAVFLLFIKYQDLISPLYISLGVVFLIAWGVAGYLCGRMLMPFLRLFVVNAVPVITALITAGMDVYAFFFERSHDAALSEEYYLTEYFIGFGGLSFPSLLARYLMNITAVRYNIFLIGFVLLMTPFAFCYINGFSHELEMKRNVSDIDGTDKRKTGSQSS